jgi:ferric-dicitrate binding protein FerR (iron transport regulator)
MKLLRFPQTPRKDPMESLLGAFAQDFPSSTQIDADLADATADELEEADAAADAILARLSLADPHVSEPAPRRVRPPVWVAGVVALAAAAAIAFFVVPTRVGPVDGTIPADVASSEVIVPLVMPLEDGPGLRLQPEALVAKETVTASDGSETHRAVLSSGGLFFERHDGIVPEIEEVRWAHLPLVAHPVGTVFDARAIGSMAIVQVIDGRVDLRNTDGAALGTVAAGQTVIVRDLGEKLDRVDVTVNVADAWSLERVRTLGPDGPALARALYEMRLADERVLDPSEIKKLRVTR